MRDHTKLKAFELADEIVILVYQIIKSFPKEEIYCLTSQMRRASVSGVSNIVEGCARESKAEYLRFLEISFGSLRKLHYQFGLSIRLGCPREPFNMKYEPKFIETEKVLGALMRSMRKEK